MKFYLRVSILSAASQMQPRLARRIRLGRAPAARPVSSGWLSVCLPLSRHLNPTGFAASLDHGCLNPGDSSAARRTSSTFLLLDFFPWVRAGPVAGEAMG